MDFATFVALRQPTPVRLGRDEIVVPAQPFGAWVGSLTEPLPLLPLLPFGEAVALNARVYDLHDPLTPAHLEQVWQQALEAQSGFDWHVAVRLLTIAVTQWDSLAGELVLRGQDPLLMPLDLILAATLALVRRHLDEKERRAVDAQIFAPPDPVLGEAKAAPRWTAEDEAADWARASASRGPRRSPARG